MSRDGYRCKRCGKGRREGVRLNVDHIRPRAERPDLALSAANCMVLCYGCHTRKTRDDARGYSLDVGADGQPADPRHPWWSV